MARTYTTVGWEDGTVLQPAKVTVQGTEYNVDNEVVTGRTPINAQNLGKMDNEIKRIVEEDIPSVYDEKLLTISDTAPSECIEGDKYYNTTDNKIYTAVATDTWSQDGDTPIEGKLYIVFNEQSTYAYNGTTLVSVGGGSGSSDIIIIGDESEATEDTKLIIEEEDMNLDLQGTDFLNERSESTTKGYSCNHINNLVEDVYSTTETKTNKVWIDGKPIYRKVYTGISTQEGVGIHVNLNITDLGEVIDYKSKIVKTSQEFIGNVYFSSSIFFSMLYNNSAKLLMYDLSGSPLVGTMSVIVEYTKTTD